MMMTAFATASARTVPTGQASGRVVVIQINGGERVTVQLQRVMSRTNYGYHQQKA
jgi:hypothetical protein